MNCFSEYYGHEDPHPLERLAYGAIAGLIGQSSSYPLDIVRRRMQTHHKPLKLRKILHKIAVEEGIILGLFKGLSMNWIKGPIAVGVSFTTFDLVHKYIKQLPILTTL